MSTYSLDDTPSIKQSDSQGMLNHVMELPTQIEQACADARRFKLPRAWRSPRNILIAGTGGGSGTGGEVVRAYLYSQLRVPFTICSGYQIPAWVDKHTLVIAASHSGNTEETLSTFHQAQMCGSRIVALTRGGKLTSELGPARLYAMQGTAMPRALIGEILVALLWILHQVDLIPDPIPQLRRAVRTLYKVRNDWSVDVPVEQNQPKQIANSLVKHIPLIIGATPDTEAVALRWKRQLGENGKTLAFWNSVPPLHHDEIVGWSAERSFTQKFAVVLLRDSTESPAIKKRLDATRDLLMPIAGTTDEAWASGHTHLARMLSLVMLGDFVSCYVALARGISPTPVPLIDNLKKIMGQ